MEKKLLIFDLDGTLVDTVVDLNASINYALKKYHFETKPVEHTAKAIGNGISITLYRSLPDDADSKKHEKVLKAFRRHYKHHYLDNSKAYPGMIETLKRLKEKGYLLAVATNKLDKIAKKMIDKLYPNIFDMVQGDVDEFPKKPDPFIINMVLRELDVDPYQAIYIGDSEVDEQTANNAHVDLMLVDYGFHRTNYFKDINCIHLVVPMQIINYLE